MEEYGIGVAIADLKDSGKCPTDTERRQVKYLNNVVEADRGKPKRLIKSTLGFKSMKTAYATIKGFDVMRALEKTIANGIDVTQEKPFVLADDFSKYDLINIIGEKGNLLGSVNTSEKTDFDPLNKSPTLLHAVLKSSHLPPTLSPVPPVFDRTINLFLDQRGEAANFRSNSHKY